MTKEQLQNLLAKVARCDNDPHEALAAQEQIKKEIERLEAACRENDERLFPIQDGPSIPWRIIQFHEHQAQENHSQSLKRLAERGGLGIQEAFYVLTDAKFSRPFITRDEALKRVSEIVAEQSNDRKRLAELEATVERLTRELTEAKFESEFTVKLKDLGFDERFMNEYRDLKMRKRELEAENTRLREALERIASGKDTSGWWTIAEAALREMKT